MELLCPLSNKKELNLLLKLDVSEFYFGLLTKKNIKNNFITNRRSNLESNFNNITDLLYCVNKIYKKGKKSFLTINEHFYTNNQVNDLLNITKKLKNKGLTGIILSDPSLILFFKEKLINIEIIASTGCNINNYNTLNFYNKLGVNRVVFPEYLSSKEMILLSKNFKDLEFETFVFNSGCYNINGLCFFQHNLCYDNPQCNSNKKATLFIKNQKIKEFEYKHTDFINYDICDICKIYYLNKTNINILKIVGREGNINDKIKYIIFVKQVLINLNSSKNFNIFFNKNCISYKQIFNKDCKHCDFND